MKVSPGKTRLWNSWYWTVNFVFDEDEYDADQTWTIYLKSRRAWVGGVLIGAKIVANKSALSLSERVQDGCPVEIRATVMPLRKDGSFSVKSEIIKFDHNDEKRFVRLPEAVQTAYWTFSKQLDEVLRREHLLDEEERRRREALAEWWRNLYVEEPDLKEGPHR